MVVAVAQWIRGYWKREIVEWQSAGRWISFDTSWGSIEIDSGPGDDGLSGKFEYQSLEPNRSNIGLAGYSDWHWRMGMNKFGFVAEKNGSFMAEVPFCVVVAAFAVLPSSWIWWRRKSHRGPGQCVVCGYDLRATPQRCPECGNTVEKTN
jgi:hypothetical protein